MVRFKALGFRVLRVLVRVSGCRALELEDSGLEGLY